MKSLTHDHAPDQSILTFDHPWSGRVFPPRRMRHIFLVCMTEQSDRAGGRCSAHASFARALPPLPPPLPAYSFDFP